MKTIIKLFLLNLILLLFSCDDPIEANFCNSQDPESPCYMPPPGPGLMSYDPHSLIIFDDSLNTEDNDNVRKLIIEKNVDALEEIDTLIISIEDGSYEFIDLDDINIGSIYSYNLKFQSFDSTFSETTVLEPFIHQYNAVDDISINLINETEADIIWNYNYSENFYKSRDSLDFTLIKEQLNQASQNIIDTSIVNLTLAIPTDSETYSYRDSTIIPNDILQYLYD